MLRHRQTKRQKEAESDLQQWLHTTALYLKDVPSVMVHYLKFVNEKLQMLELVDQFRVVTFCPEEQLLMYRLEKKTGYQVTFSEMSREECQHVLADDDTKEMQQQKPLFMRLQQGEEYVRIRKHEHGCCPERVWWYHDCADCYIVPARHPAASKVNTCDALEGMVIWATSDDQGFSSQHIDFINATFPALWAILRSQNQTHVTKRLIRSYLGHELGARVSNGSVVRGNVFSTRSVVWFSDIRQYSKLTSGLEQEEIVGVISEVCQITSETVVNNAGEILKISDGRILAIWKEKPFRKTARLRHDKSERDEGNTAALCAQARKAAQEVQNELEKLRRSRKALYNVSVGIGLHYGQISYGIAGARNHMDLVAIGPCVNLASRVEGLCSKLQAAVLASEDFVKLDGANKEWQGRGSYSIRGVDDPIMIFQLNL